MTDSKSFGLIIHSKLEVSTLSSGQMHSPPLLTVAPMKLRLDLHHLNPLSQSFLQKRSQDNPEKGTSWP
jgi:hypothetical protein